MSDRSEKQVETKQNRGVSQAPGKPPSFQPGLLLDLFSGEMADRSGYAELLLRTVDGQEFRCFVDGIVAKGYSDRLLALAGHLIIQSHGETEELRPLHELHEDPDDLEDMPAGVPAMALEKLPDPEAMHGAADGFGGSDFHEDFAIHPKGSAHVTPPPATEPAPTFVPNPSPEGHRPSVQAFLDAKDDDTRDFLESFGGKPDSYFSGTFVREIIKQKIGGVDQTDPRVREVMRQAGIA